MLIQLNENSDISRQKENVLDKNKSYINKISFDRNNTPVDLYSFHYPLKPVEEVDLRNILEDLIHEIMLENLKKDRIITFELKDDVRNSKLFRLTKVIEIKDGNFSEDQLNEILKSFRDFVSSKGNFSLSVY